MRSKYPAAVNFNLERTKCAPWGLWYGRPGTVCEAWVQSSPDSPWLSVTKHTRYPIFPESRVVFLTAGSGGWGDPLDRDPELVAVNVREGYISRVAAADYGVVLDPTSGAVDLKGTETLRARLREERKDQK